MVLTTIIGRPRKPPEERTRPLVIRVLEEDRDALRRMAADRGLSLSAFVALVLKLHLEGKG